MWAKAGTATPVCPLLLRHSNANTNVKSIFKRAIHSANPPDFATLAHLFSLNKFIASVEELNANLW